MTGPSYQVFEDRYDENFTAPVAPSYTRKKHSSAYTTSTLPSPSKSNAEPPVCFDDASWLGCDHLMNGPSVLQPLPPPAQSKSKTRKRVPPATASSGNPSPSKSPIVGGPPPSTLIMAGTAGSHCVMTSITLCQLPVASIAKIATRPFASR